MKEKTEKKYKIFSNFTSLLCKAVFLFLILFVFSNPAQASNMQATVISKSHEVINMLPGKSITFSVRLKNTGEKTWTGKDGNIYLMSVNTKSPLKHKFWTSDNLVKKIPHKILPQQEIIIKFALKAPEALGLYEEKFILATSKNSVISGSLFTITVNSTLYPNAKQPKKQEVLGTSTTSKQTASKPSTQLTVNSSVKQLKIDKQPDITVGLFFTEPYSNPKPITITADTTFDMFTSGIKQSTFGAGSIISVEYKNGVYNITLPNKKIVSLSGFPIFKLQNTGRFEMLSYENRAKWNRSINYNKFEGDIIIKYNPRTKRLWAINKLPLEKYLEGITETSNINIPEYQKSVAIAARSYALYRIQNNRKYRGFFNIHRLYDQVYNGYASKITTPLYVNAVKDTYGQVMVYDGKPILAKYYTQSNGRSKSAKEVWGYEIPYLQSKPIPWDTGKKLLGHGVGMSVKAGREMAKQGKTYKDILKYFYTNIDIQKVYP